MVVASGTLAVIHVMESITLIQDMLQVDQARRG